MHQDDFYFGLDDLNATLTVRIDLRGRCIMLRSCRERGWGWSKVRAKLRGFLRRLSPTPATHFKCYNLLRHTWFWPPAPVPAGGVSFHHGNTWHQSSSNTSPRARRAVVFHYLRNDATLVNPALDYDHNML